MASKDFISQFASMSSTRIQQGLDKGAWEEDKKEAAFTILTRRGIDISKWQNPSISEVSEEQVVYEDNTPESLDSKTIKTIDKVIEKVANSGNQDLASKVLEIMGETQTKDLSPEQAEQILELTKSAKKETTVKSKKNVELSAQKKEIATEILGKKLPKKEKIVNLVEAGFTRTEILSLNFVDPTYVYDLIREFYPKLCKK